MEAVQGTRQHDASDDAPSGRARGNFTTSVTLNREDTDELLTLGSDLYGIDSLSGMLRFVTKQFNRENRRAGTQDAVAA